MKKYSKFKSTKPCDLGWLDFCCFPSFYRSSHITDIEQMGSCICVIKGKSWMNRQHSNESVETVKTEWMGNVKLMKCPSNKKLNMWTSTSFPGLFISWLKAGFSLDLIHVINMKWVFLRMEKKQSHWIYIFLYSSSPGSLTR